MLLFAAAVVGTEAAAGQDARPRPEAPSGPAAEYAWVVFGNDTIRAEVARTVEEHERGLMFRDSVPDGTGMLFVFEEAEVQGVWMKDTYVPLDVAFLDERSRVSSIEALEPRDLTVKYATGPVLFALEVPRGWFREHGVRVGDRPEIVFGAERSGPP